MKQNDVRCTATAREEFVNVLASKLASVNGKYLTNLAKVMGYSNSKFTDMKKGEGYVRPKDLPRVFEYCGITQGDEYYNKLLDLELECIAGRHENAMLNEYIKTFSNDAAACEDNDSDDAKAKREFSEKLVKWLFLNAYTIRMTCQAIGCSTEELKAVIDGKCVLSPYHVARFKETLKMDESLVNELVHLSNRCYKGHEIPQALLKYIASDISIINTLQKICDANKPAEFWKKINKDLL